MHASSYPRITTDEVLMEIISHGSHEYPFEFNDETMSMFDFYTIDWHWHAEPEFVLVEEGSISVSIGTETLTLGQGEGIFINSREFHRFRSEEDAVIPNFLFSASFIAPVGSLVYQKHVEPLLTNGPSWVTLKADTPWQAEVLSSMKKVIALQRGGEPDEMGTLAAVCELWTLLTRSIPEGGPSAASGRDTAAKARLLMMMQYIQDSYASAITLEDIAAHASVSKSTALNLFRRFLQTTPVDYLISYRLTRAAAMLSQTEQKIGAVSESAGFVTVEYFCRAFKKHYRMTPTEYRKRHTL